MTVRSILSTLLIAGFTLATLPSVAEATPVRLIRIQEVNPEDALVAAQLTVSVSEAANRVPGWTVSPVTTGIWDLMANNECIDVTHPGIECLHRMATTTGSGAYGAILIHGFLYREGEGPDTRMRVEVFLYDAVVLRITHHVEGLVTPAQLADQVTRDRFAVTLVDRLSSSSVSDEIVRIETDDPAVDAASVSTPSPSIPDHSGVEIAGWSLVGLAGASALVAIVSGGLMLGHNSDARYNAYRASWDGARVGNVCDAAAADPSAEGRYALGVCNDAQIHDVLVPLFWTVAAIAGAAGTVLAWHPWTPASGEGAEARLTPVLGPSLAALDFTLDF